ncbi:hypothetical protein IWX64_003385 [Arthrobacter sp. CAN_A212]|uniref:ATP-grasp fold amidoligase family protein n=1 Tax=Arthrobacter sp. CAN_A212 TaxID=2787719 RepID=UPI0018CB0C2C
METRISHKEPNIPWFLQDKLKCYEFCRDNGFAAVEVLRKFDTPSDITIENLPREFVIKPSLQHSTRGVMVLEQRNGIFYDHLRRRSLTIEEIMTEQAKYFDQTKSLSKRIMIEEKILDQDDFAVPRDFKAYAFKGEVALIVEIDRNVSPAGSSWFDGEFAPIEDDRVTCDRSFVTIKPSVRPRNWESILDLAQRVSAAIPTPFASIDMYATRRGPLVGEITLTPGGLYYGKYYQLSQKQQELMGLMWQKASRE